MKLQFKPTVVKDDSPLASGAHTDSDKIRWVLDKWQSRGGAEKTNASPLLGIARGAHAWADTGRNPYAAFGTHLRLYAMDVDGNQYDITPVTSRGEITNPFTTAIDEIQVNVTHANHGLVVDQKVSYSGASVVGGLDLNGEHVVTEIVDANNYIIEAGFDATSTAGPAGGTVDYQYYLAPGQIDGLGGLGYGTGGYGTGGYGSPSSGYQLFPRTWSMDNWGQNLIANPRGGAIFEWAPNVTATELVTNGTFLTVSGWSVGQGWSIGSGVAIGSAASGALQQNITLNNGAWHLLSVDVSVGSGSLSFSQDTTGFGVTVTSSQNYKVAFFSGGGVKSLRINGSVFNGSVANVSVQVLTTASQITNAPDTVTSIFVTAERILVAAGCDDSAGTFDPLLVRWSGQQNNQVWTPLPTNLAGDYQLSQGTRIVRGIAGRGENLIFTDTAVYSMRFVPDINVVYRFDLLGTGCGLIGPNAVVQLNGVTWWMTPDYNIYRYAGGNPQPVESGNTRYVKDNFAAVQMDKVYASSISEFGEIQFIYPSLQDGNECSRYLKINLKFQEDIGTTSYTTWLDKGVFQFPLAVDTDGYVWYEEKGFDREGAAMSGFIESSYIDLDKGNEVVINGLYPDNDDLQGGYTVTPTIKNRDARGNFERTLNPYNVTSATGRVSMRAKGKQIKCKWAWNDAPVFVRQGADDWDIQKKRGRN